jgi:hypothetical protein
MIHLYLAVQILLIFSYRLYMDGNVRCREAAGDAFKATGGSGKSHRAEHNGLSDARFII